MHHFPGLRGEKARRVCASLSSSLFKKYFHTSTSVTLHVYDRVQILSAWFHPYLYDSLRLAWWRDRTNATPLSATIHRTNTLYELVPLMHAKPFSLSDQLSQWPTTAVQKTKTNKKQQKTPDQRAFSTNRAIIKATLVKRLIGIHKLQTTSIFIMHF